MSTPSKSSEPTFTTLHSFADFPTWLTPDSLATWFSEIMVPYNDDFADTRAAVDYAFKPGVGQGGFLTMYAPGDNLQAACLMLKTGMTGYIPEWILLMIAVDPSLRGQGIGGKLMAEVLSIADGDVKLHVEHDNPAKRLYERVGFTSKYAEMRYHR